MKCFQIQFYILYCCSTAATCFSMFHSSERASRIEPGQVCQKTYLPAGWRVGTKLNNYNTLSWWYYLFFWSEASQGQQMWKKKLAKCTTVSKTNQSNDCSNLIWLSADVHPQELSCTPTDHLPCPRDECVHQKWKSSTGKNRQLQQVI